MDPCEKEKTDAAASLTLQERELLTAAAQVRNHTRGLNKGVFFVHKPVGNMDTDTYTFLWIICKVLGKYKGPSWQMVYHTVEDRHP